MSKQGCSKQYCNFRHAPAKKGTALVAAVKPKPKAKAKADASHRAATPGAAVPGKNKLAKAKSEAKKANALVASIEEQRKAAT